MTHSGQVLAQRQIDGKSNEIPAFAPLLDSIDLTSAVITADALHAQHDHTTYLHKRGAHYLAVVKRNHPALHESVQRLPWRDVRLDHYERGRAHHRDEIRRLRTAAFAHLDYPHARQALQAVRRRRDLGTGKPTIERIYLVTSLPPGVATGSELATWIRGHWRIENQLHHVRDRTFHEDASKTRTACSASWPACAISPSVSTARTATPTSQPPSAAAPVTTFDPSPPSDWHDEPGHKITSQRPCTSAWP
ncbi:ISAs1 family transposase [Streptomyces sp. NPDC058420]|uniref:ISAs1 family transposase n=1 Tax=Streptomyces sp. NPDC058420 TaxID=3346489 RepID=UPI0036670801